MIINSLVFNNVNKIIWNVNSDTELESFINGGLNIDTSKELILIAHQNKKIYSSIEIYPLYIELQNCNDLYELFNNAKIVALEKLGIDSLKYIISNENCISFIGRVISKIAKKSIEILKNVSNTLFLVETDSHYISKKIAEVKCMNYQEISNITTNNVMKLFKK